MSQPQQRRPYEGYSYPTTAPPTTAGGQDAVSGGYIGSARVTPSTAAAFSGAAGTTGLIRRSPQHTSGPGFPTYQGSYGYFHGQGNSIDFNSGYNSDAGSSTSNALYGSGGNAFASSTPPLVSGVTVDSTRGGAAPANPNLPELGAGIRVVDSSSRTRILGSRSPLPLSPPPRAAEAFTSFGEGRPTSLTDSTVSSFSARQPAPQSFLPSSPLAEVSSQPTAQPYRPHQQQFFVAPLPSSTHADPTATDSGDTLPPDLAFTQRSERFAVSPTYNAAPRMPIVGDPSASLSATTSNTPGRTGRVGFFSRLISQVLPVLGDSAEPVDGQASYGPVKERPSHQLRFGNPEDDLPLLEELGIFPGHIWEKARAVLNPFKMMTVEAAKDTDLAGPILFALSLALLLSLRGKIQFSAIYGLFVLGVVFFKMLLSLMQPHGEVPLQFVVSTVGYGLLPSVLLAVVRTVGSWLLTRRGVLPFTFLMVMWSAWCGTTMVAKGLSMEKQRYLVLYPMLLFYAAFDVVTVF